ncbi:MAG: sigma-70 family RNA polymerase sigma factor [Xenococcaceae cyanobacterium MO_207.B15]|nr:sigma-70 family RNA polymerase sigma factor [Xenococcaceae cyanobacterium MO_207.B15]
MSQSPSNKFDKQIKRLILETCQHPRDSFERKSGLTKLIQTITQSKKLWYCYNPFYEDALQQTWLYFCRNLCEANTGKKYDPNQSQVITWLNSYLKYRLLSFQQEIQQQNEKKVSLSPIREETTTDPIQQIPATPEIPPILEETLNWVKNDPGGELSSIHIKKRPDITCQVLILRRLPPPTDWKTLEAEFNCSYSTLANFYKRQCRPRLRQFALTQGFLE